MRSEFIGLATLIWVTMTVKLLGAHIDGRARRSHWRRTWCRYRRHHWQHYWHVAAGALIDGRWG
jgi:hypothetical protein